MPYKVKFIYLGKYQAKIDIYLNNIKKDSLVIKDKNALINDIKSWIKEYAPKYIVEDTDIGITIDNYEIIHVEFKETKLKPLFEVLEVSDIHLSAEGYSVKFIIDINAE